MAFTKDENELGCLWEKSGAKGQYFTGTIEIDGTKHAVVVFKNGNKKSDKAPDWRILKAQPRDQTRRTDGDSPNHDRSAPTADDIPF